MYPSVSLGVEVEVFVRIETEVRAKHIVFTSCLGATEKLIQDSGVSDSRVIDHFPVRVVPRIVPGNAEGKDDLAWILTGKKTANRTTGWSACFSL